MIPMHYHISGEYLVEDKKDCQNIAPDVSCFCVLSREELISSGRKLSINEKFIHEYMRNNTPKYESHDSFDYISLNVPNETDLKKEPHRVGIYLTARSLIFVCGKLPIIDDIIKDLQSDGLKNLSLGRILYLFLDKLTINDKPVLETIEQEIADLEERLITDKANISREIILLRRRLLALKRYYEQLLDIAEEIEQNENDFLDKKILRYFRMITSRIDRLYHDVLNLRDYVTQVREAYQAQIDIDLNSIMKFFTVITSIFLPLTLIVGWYGMNVKMPEYDWEYGYIFVIAISIAAAAFTIAYFKKKKWF